MNWYHIYDQTDIVVKKKISLFMSVELSNFCIWSECQHTRKVCIFLFQAITLPNFCCCWISRKSHFVFETGIFLSFKIFSSTWGFAGFRSQGMTFAVKSYSWNSFKMLVRYHPPSFSICNLAFCYNFKSGPRISWEFCALKSTKTLIKVNIS